MKVFKLEKKLIQDLKSGDKRALTTLYTDYWKQLYLSSYNLLKDKETCEEIIQDVFIDIWNRRADLEIKVSLKSYLYSCVRYKVFSEFRKNKALRTELFENLHERIHTTTPESEILFEELKLQINLIVENLPDKCKRVYKLSRNQQLTHKEISEQLNISTKTVENHITNALNVLRASLGICTMLYLFSAL